MWNAFSPGFELVSPCPIPATITITPRAPMFVNASLSQNPSLMWINACQCLSMILLAKKAKCKVNLCFSLIPPRSSQIPGDVRKTKDRACPWDYIYLYLPPGRIWHEIFGCCFHQPGMNTRWTLGNPEREAISRNLSYLPLGRIWLKIFFYCGIKRVSAHLLLVRCTQSPKARCKWVIDCHCLLG